MTNGRRGSYRWGFTLIELLIVVAIIAILAGIAVVNFLEAQTRAKVARVQNDLRTVATGLELYRVDHAAYPTYHYVQNEAAQDNWSFHVGGEMTGIFQSPPFDGKCPLTTPISYLSTMPVDVFGKRTSEGSPETAQHWYVNWDYAIARVTGGFQQVFMDLREKQVHGDCIQAGRMVAGRIRMWASAMLYMMQATAPQAEVMCCEHSDWRRCSSFSRGRRATETPFNMVLEARP